jgi:hypothetical protein
MRREPLHDQTFRLIGIERERGVPVTPSPQSFETEVPVQDENLLVWK